MKKREKMRCVDLGRPDYEGFARYYDQVHSDLIHPNYPALVSFYSGLANASTRALLELGCGTGNFTIPLSRKLTALHGRRPRLVGLDASEAMLRIAASRCSEIEWVHGDMRTLTVSGPFDLIVCCFNTLQALSTDRDLDQALAAAQGVLSQGGRFAFDVYNPNWDYLQVPRRLSRPFRDSDGRQLELNEFWTYDARTRVLHLAWRVHEAGKGNSAPLARLEHRIRQYTPPELETRLRTAGLAIVERYGDLDKSPFGPMSKKQVIVCKNAQ